MHHHHGKPAIDLLSPVSESVTLRLDADAILDAQGMAAAPGSLLLRLQPREPASDRLFNNVRRAHITVLAAGSPAIVDAASSHLGTSNSERRIRVGGTLTPAFVNAHTHLDLTHIGPTPHDPRLGFSPFVKLVVFNRRQDEQGIADSVRRGVELSLAGGVVAIGDICGQTRTGPTAAAWRALANCPVLGVGFLEYFGIGKGEQAAIDVMTRVIADLDRNGSLSPTLPVRVGLQPHAPYSVSLRGYEFAVAQAARSKLPLATHLAETPEERRFIACGDGPKRTMLEDIGIWDDSELEFIGRGQSPVAHLGALLARRPMLAVHLNDLSDADIAALAASRATAAYCPRSSEYFGNHEHFGPHRYRDLLAAGVDVALGTDSVINLPSQAGTDAVGMSTLDEARRLFARDATDPRALLGMITTSGAAALHIDPARFTFTPGAPLAGLVGTETATQTANHAIELATSLMASHARPRLALLGV